MTAKSKKSTPKRPVGRPRIGQESVAIRFPNNVLRAVDRWRSQQEGVPTRQQAIRQIVAERFGAMT